MYLVIAAIVIAYFEFWRWVGGGIQDLEGFILCSLPGMFALIWGVVMQFFSKNGEISNWFAWFLASLPFVFFILGILPPIAVIFWIR